MRFTRGKMKWMAWLVVFSMMLSAGPAVFAETVHSEPTGTVKAAEEVVPAGGKVSVTAANYSKGTFTAVFSGLQNPQVASQVYFRVWSTAADAKSYTAAKQANGSYTKAINIANHSYAGTYQVEAYTVDTKGETRLHGRATCNMKAAGTIKVKYLNSNKYRVTITGVKYPAGFKTVKIAIWSQKKGRDDLRWYKAKKKKGKYIAEFKLSKHKHLGAYTSHLYVTDKKGKSRFAVQKNFNIAEPYGGKVSLTSVNVSKGTFTAKMTGIKNKSRMKRVRFKVWSTSGNVKWYTAKKQKNGSYTAKINISKHGYNRGVYNVYGYTVDKKNDYKANSSTTRSMALPKQTTKKTPVLYASKLKQYNSSTKKLGIDVSHHQGTIDWAKVKADGIQFAVIRCGYGSNLTSQDDRQWARNVSECKKRSIPFSVYIYSHAKKVSQAQDEADHCIRLLRAQSVAAGTVVYYDLEDPTDTAPLSNAKLAEITAAWATKIKNAGYTPGVYSSLSWWNSKLTNSVFDQYVKWIAQWPVNYTASSKTSYTRSSYKMWQFSDNGRVNGISGAVDLNWMY